MSAGRHRRDGGAGGAGAVWEWLRTRDVAGYADPNLPVTAPRCRICRRTVVLPEHLPRRYRVFCDECFLLDQAW